MKHVDRVNLAAPHCLIVTPVTDPSKCHNFSNAIQTLVTENIIQLFDSKDILAGTNSREWIEEKLSKSKFMIIFPSFSTLGDKHHEMRNFIKKCLTQNLGCKVIAIDDPSAPMDPELQISIRISIDENPNRSTEIIREFIEKELLDEYLYWIKSEWGREEPFLKNYQELSSYLPNKINLADVYIDRSPANAPRRHPKSAREILPGYIPSARVMMPLNADERVASSTSTDSREIAVNSESVELTEPRFMLIHGSPGSGKTVWLKHRRYDLAKKAIAMPGRSDQTTVQIPLLFDAAQFSRGSATDLSGLIRHGLLSWTTDQRKIDVLVYCLLHDSDYELVFLLDGIDEPPRPIDRLSRWLAEHHASRHHQFRMLITSRPIPTRPVIPRSDGVGSDPITTRFLEPLSDIEIQDYAERFFKKLGPEVLKCPAFLANLKGNRAVLEMARVPFFLGLLAVEFYLYADLPFDKQYQIVDSLVTELVDGWRKSDGTLWSSLLPHAGMLAARMMEDQFKQGGDRPDRDFEPANTDRPKLNALKPKNNVSRKDWNTDIDKLIERGILLNENAGRIRFAHRIIQECLASHFYYSRESAERIRTFRERLPYIECHQSLLHCLERMLSEREGDQNPQPEALALCRELTGARKTEAYALGWLGAGLASGHLDELLFEHWSKSVFASLRDRWVLDCDYHLIAWSSVPPGKWHLPLANKLNKEMPDADRFVHWLRLYYLALPLMEMRDAVAPPAIQAGRALLDSELARGASTELDYARNRVLCAVDPLWPREPIELALLNCWPSRRRVVGLQLQAAANLGANKEDLQRLTRGLMSKGSERSGSNSGTQGHEDRDIGAVRAMIQKTRTTALFGAVADSDSWSIEFLQQLHEVITAQWAQDWLVQARTHFQQLAPDLLGGRNESSSVALERLEGRFFELPALWIASWYLKFTRAAEQWTNSEHLTKTLHDRWLHLTLGVIPDDAILPSSERLDPQVFALLGPLMARSYQDSTGIQSICSRHGGHLPGWFVPWMHLEVAAMGRNCGLLLLAHLESQDPPLLRAVSGAARVALSRRVAMSSQGDDGAQGEASASAIATLPESHRLFQALAKYIAGMEDEDDVRLLGEASSAPEQWSPKDLSWGLRWLIRGDVVLQDGQILHHEALAKEAGVEPLPLIDKNIFTTVGWGPPYWDIRALMEALAPELGAQVNPDIKWEQK